MCDGEALERYAKLGDAFQLGALLCGITVRPVAFRNGSCSAGPMTQGTPLRSMETRGVSVRQREWLGEAGPHLVDLDAQFSEFWIG